jgi:SSS family solute:Na+ symporter
VENLDELPKSKLISQLTVLGGSVVGIIFAFHMTDILDA